jgi:hypothetical protein
MSEQAGQEDRKSSSTRGTAHPVAQPQAGEQAPRRMGTGPMQPRRLLTLGARIEEPTTFVRPLNSLLTTLTEWK